MPTSMDTGLTDVASATPASVAEQLWVIEQERFSAIEAHEFVDTVELSDDDSVSVLGACHVSKGLFKIRH